MLYSATDSRESRPGNLDVVDTLRLYASFYDKAESGECSLISADPRCRVFMLRCRLHNYHCLSPAPALSETDRTNQFPDGFCKL